MELTQPDPFHLLRVMVDSPPGVMTTDRCPVCGSEELHRVFSWDEPPEGETRFKMGEGTYRREFWRCSRCLHMIGRTGLDLDELYRGTYVDATYSGAGMRDTYRRIMALPRSESDNIGRVERVCGFMEKHAPRGGRSLLDVGSGLAVFGARMREAGWHVIALDPDPRACEHARREAALETVCADFMAEDGLGRFDLVSFNKVLEHVPDPMAMLRPSLRFLAPGGFVYVEVPDGELAAVQGARREEFFIEHLHAFSLTSLSLLASGAGFMTKRVERMHEPSDKYTLCAFLQQAGGLT